MTELEQIRRLKSDARQAAKTLTETEARFLVDAYYISQADRQRSYNQVRALTKSEEPHSLVQWLGGQNETLENEIKKLLDVYTDSRLDGVWMKSLYGVGPVIAAGMLAHIDVRRAKTCGAVWRFAGLDPTVVWNKGEKRPWNASLKTLCWKSGQSFMKFAGNDDCFYGHVYRNRKAEEVARNDRGENTGRAATILATKRFKPSTEAYKHYMTGKLPPAQIDAMARRHAVKLFLSHIFMVMYFSHFGKLPPSPYAIAILGHAHFIPPPNAWMIPGLVEALGTG